MGSGKRGEGTLRQQCPPWAPQRVGRIGVVDFNGPHLSQVKVFPSSMTKGAFIIESCESSPTRFCKLMRL